MLFNSPEYFFAFLPVAALVYFLLQRFSGAKAAKVWLVAASLYFYAYWNVAYLPLIIVSILVNYTVANLLHRVKSRQSAAVISAKSILVMGIIFNLGLLAYFKYTDFFIENVNVVLGSQFDLLHVLLPLAISFFTFQQIAYLVDGYKFDIHEYDFLSYCLFVCFFPQLIAGPIVHHKEMMPQFLDRNNTSPHAENIARGVLLFGIGLFKKVVIADTFAMWADPGFSAVQDPSFLEAWQTSLCYTFQLYYDFSGYTDMALGAALLFNIRLPLNFNSPYKALDIQDFWRRWHMTLSRWLKDYLYIPLGGNRHGSLRTYFNLFATFLLGGLWHGAGWTFILWGSLHGFALILHRLWSNSGRRIDSAFAWLITFLFVNFAWVIFRAEDMQGAGRLVAGMLGLNGFGLDQNLQDNIGYFAGLLRLQGPVDVDNLMGPVGAALFIAIFGLIAFLGKNSMEIAADKTRFSMLDVLTVAAAIFLTLLLGIASTSSVFLYFNF